MKQVYIYYNCTWEEIRRIQQRFGFPESVTVNGESCQPVEVKEDDLELLRETARRGYIQIRMKDDTDKQQQTDNK